MSSYEKIMKKLFQKLKTAGIDEETSVIISLQLMEQEDMERMLLWMGRNPEASLTEICDKAQELHEARVM